jgi:triosephosphate isomerase
MNGLLSSIDEARAVAEGSFDSVVKIAIFPPFTLLHAIAQTLGSESHIILGGQDCHFEDNGAYTGDISASQLRDVGARMVLLGHSERRHGHKEPCELVALKVKAAIKAGLEPLICIGETLAMILNHICYTVARLNRIMPRRFCGLKGLGAL